MKALASSIGILVLAWAGSASAAPARGNLASVLLRDYHVGQQDRGRFFRDDRRDNRRYDRRGYGRGHGRDKWRWGHGHGHGHGNGHGHGHGNGHGPGHGGGHCRGHHDDFCQPASP